MHSPRSVIVSSAVAFVLLIAPLARAQNAQAEGLFVEGRRLMQEEQFEAACKKFKASYELDRTATGTLLNLALCHERMGKNASAWTEFRQASAESLGKRPDRVELADKHAAEIRKKLAYAAFIVAGSAQAPGLTITLDDADVPMPAVAWGTPVLIDPGPHVLKLSATDKKPATQSFEIRATTEVQDVVVSTLVDAPKPLLVGRDDSRATLRTVGIVLSAAGVAAGGVGTYFGIRAVSQHDDARRQCDGLCEDSAALQRANAKHDDANTSANIANVTVIAAAAFLATGVTFFLLSRPSNKPRVSVGLASFSLTSSF